MRKFEEKNWLKNCRNNDKNGKQIVETPRRKENGKKLLENLGENWRKFGKSQKEKWKNS